MRDRNRKLMVIDTSYTYEMIIKRNLIKSVTCRDIDGYFEHVWSVHPFASLLDEKKLNKRYGDPKTYIINDSHTFIDGKIGKFQFLHRLAPLNFIISQLILIVDLISIIKREKVSVIRVGGPLYVGMLGLVLSKWTRTPLLVRVGANYDKIYEVTKRPIEQRLFRFRYIEKIVEKLVFSNADMVAGANQNNLSFALQNGAIEKKSTIFRYGNLLDSVHFIAPFERNHLVDKTISKIFKGSFRIIAYIGRLQAEKHPEDVLEVFARIALKYSDVKLVMIGDGDLISQLQEVVSAKNLGSRVFLVGNRNQEWISTVLCKSSIVLSPHTGRALIESALAINGVVAYDVDWQGEIIQNGKNGYLVNYRDVDSMYDCTVKLLEKKDLLKDFSESLRRDAIAMMSPEKLNKHEKNIYSHLIGE